MDEVEKVFLKFDANGNGKIPLSEIGAIQNYKSAQNGKLSGRKNKSEGIEQAKSTENVKKPEGEGTQKGSTTDEERDAAATTHGEGAGKRMMDRLKGVATSWFHKGGEKTAAAAAHTPTSSPDTT